MGEEEEESNITNAAKKLLGPLGRVPLGMVKVCMFFVVFFWNKVAPVGKEVPFVNICKYTMYILCFHQQILMVYLQKYVLLKYLIYFVFFCFKHFSNSNCIKYCNIHYYQI